MSKRYSGGFLSAVWTPLAEHGDENKLYLWGYNFNGQLGGNSVIDRSSPTQVGALYNWSQIATGDNHPMAIKQDGTMWLWGRNTYGQVGDNTIEQRSSPVQIGSLTSWYKIDAGYDHAMALKTDGTMWTWGKSSDCGQRHTKSHRFQ